VGEIYIGTSGFSYADWDGHFYPEGTKKADYLLHYSKFFRTVEINYSYYTLPTAKSMALMLDKSNGTVRFAVKLTRVFTHERTGGPQEVSRFLAAVEPLARAGVLGCLLAQFPGSFRPTAEAGRQIEQVASWFGEHPLVVEVRHASWGHPRFFEFLRERGVGFCCVDEPQLPGLLPPTEHVTSPTAYVRFHGRNAAKWWRHERPEERYDYLYSEAELAEWVPRIRRMAAAARETFVFFNNHFEGKAVANAVTLAEMLSRP
jgi:uncharacterized protein YecE (DUF72 family)